MQSVEVDTREEQSSLTEYVAAQIVPDIPAEEGEPTEPGPAPSPTSLVSTATREMSEPGIDHELLGQTLPTSSPRVHGQTYCRKQIQPTHRSAYSLA